LDGLNPATAGSERKEQRCSQYKFHDENILFPPPFKGNF
jgi:hypothetical protein